MEFRYYRGCWYIWLSETWERIAQRPSAYLRTLTARIKSNHDQT